MICFGILWGLEGILYSGPFADALAFILAIGLLIYEIRILNKNPEINNLSITDTNTKNTLNKKVIITISREYGSGGRYIGKLVADKLGIKLYDKDLVEKLSKETGFSKEYIESTEQKRNSLDIFNSGYYAGLNNSDELFINESNLIKEIAEKEPCVIIGRCADFILEGKEHVFKVFIYSNMKNKIDRAINIYGLDEEKAKKEINRIDKLRSNHYKYYTGREWSNKRNYDICINSDALGVEKSADLICEFIKKNIV